MGKVYIGIDNGVTGTIGIITDYGCQFAKTPVKTEQDYTKKKKNITRLQFGDFKAILGDYKGEVVQVIIERPMVNPTRFLASLTAERCFEAELVAIEELGFPIRYIDSKEWQKEMLPHGVEKGELKKASLDIGNRLFPQFREFKHPDRDSLLIAEYARRKNF